ncbi:uncharacterized protein LOC111351085 [Spodoptera litura]|uniref:Uncharacterized protein LOC111351085 n=1 Tax=Spodoptera litura TaxID=69820 RepID=A0A9J7ILR9_SPOLT|nr:uncharacterized protein LOC111351085 [Spodoptera litura]
MSIPDLAAITVASRMSEFWTHQPRMWFIRTEAVLAPQKLGDASKFDLVVSKLGIDALSQVTDFLINPPETNKYEALKKLISIYEDSKNRQIEKLISEMQLGDQKPSQLLRRMKDLARDKVPDDTLRVLWQNLLPTTVRSLLVVTENKDLDKLAVVADDVFEAIKVNSIAEVNQQPQPSSLSSENTILAEIAKLSTRLAQVEKRTSENRSRNNNRNQRAHTGRGRSVTRSATRNPNWLCFYHFRYAGNAKKCVKPCAWENKSEN